MGFASEGGNEFPKFGKPFPEMVYPATLQFHEPLLEGGFAWKVVRGIAFASHTSKRE